jgi:hypothetical protein
MDEYLIRDDRKRDATIRLLLYQYRRSLEAKPYWEVSDLMRKQALLDAHLTQVIDLSLTPPMERMIELLALSREDYLHRLTFRELAAMLDLDA